MSKMLYVPTSSSTLNTGGFKIEEITAWEYTPVGNKDREKSLLKIIIKGETLYFFDNVADNLIYQIESYLQSIVIKETAMTKAFKRPDYLNKQPDVKVWEV